MLSDEQQHLLRELREIQETMGTQGWKLVMDEIESVIANAKEVAHDVCDTNDKWQRHRGEMVAYRWFQGFEASVDAAIYDLENPGEEEQE